MDREDLDPEKVLSETQIEGACSTEHEIQEYNAEKRGAAPSGRKARRPTTFKVYICQKRYTR